MYILSFKFLFQNLVSRRSFCSSEVPFSHFSFYLCLFDDVPFQYSQVLVVFLFSKHFDAF